MLLLALLTIVSATCIHGHHVVFMHTFVNYSHRQAMMPLANALAERGHTITYISPIGPKTGDYVHSNIQDIVPETFSAFTDQLIRGNFNIDNRVTDDQPNSFAILDELNTMCCKVLLESPEIQQWLSSQSNVDLIIVDYYPSCALGLGHKFGAKVILFESMALWGREVELFGLPNEAGASFIDCAQWEGRCSSPASFGNRLKSLLVPAAWRYYEWRNSENLFSVLRHGLNLTGEIPSIVELQQNIALVFMTSNYVIEQARSLPPMFVNVPSLHVRKPQPLPKEILKFIENDDDDGFVFISLGTLVEVKIAPESVLQVVLNTTAALPRLKFLFKWDGPPGKFVAFKNVLAKNWFPQQDVLGHPKCRGFVTQTGRPSSVEGVSHSVPMVTLPVFSDQDLNAQRLSDIGVAIRLEITSMTEADFTKAITEIVYNPKYKAAAVQQNNLQHDLPMKPIDTAVWWTEYVLRHADLRHLKAPGAQLAWWQRYWLDVIGFLFVVLGGSVFAFYKMLRIVLRVWLRLMNTGKDKLKRS